MSEIVETLRALLRCTLDEKAVVLANAAEARATLQLLLTSLPHPDAAASAHLGALGAAIDQAEAHKIAALEAEAVTVENALVDYEGVDGEHGVYSDAVLRRTRALPLSCIEPSTVQVISAAVTSPLERCLSAYVIAPRALSPDDLIVRTLGPPWLRPGHSVGVLELSVAPSVIEGRPDRGACCLGQIYYAARERRRLSAFAPRRIARESRSTPSDSDLRVLFDALCHLLRRCARRLSTDGHHGFRSVACRVPCCTAWRFWRARRVYASALSGTNRRTHTTTFVPCPCFDWQLALILRHF